MTHSDDAPRSKAVALRYDADKEHSPKVVAKGSGFLAQRILELAREHDIQVHEDPDLVEVLAKLDVNTEIPERLYQAVAQVLAFLYRINNRPVARS